MARCLPRRFAFGASILAVALSACHWTPETTSGVESVIRVAGGQAVRGSISDPASTSAATTTFSPGDATIYAGLTNKSVKGIAGPNANTVAIGVAGDVAYWRVPALDPVGETNPDFFNYAAALSISREIWSSPLIYPTGDGTYTLPLSTRAIDNAGNFGDAKIQPLILNPVAITGTLAVTLQWDTPTDLDLHVLFRAGTDPGYVEVWAKKRSAFKGDAGAGLTSDGILDFDSNANCQIDGRDVENVIWQEAPPAGHYIVRVAAASLCGETSAAWWAYASVPGVSKGESSGVLTDQAATRVAEGDGSGVTAFEFYYP